jgi:DNA-binding Lrp family transcriptional regulator
MIEGKSMKEVANFVSSKLAPMEAVLSTATHFVLKKYKEHGLPLVNEKTDERMLITP